MTTISEVTNTVKPELALAAVAICRGIDQPDELRAALERARVVGVLDGWAGDPLKSRAAWYTATSDDMSEWRCTLYPENISRGAKHYFGSTPDEARAKAAAAIERGEV